MIPLEDIIINGKLSAWINEEKKQEYIVIIDKEYLELNVNQYWRN